MIRWGDVTFRSDVFSGIVGTTHNLLDLFHYSARLQRTTSQAIGEGDQSRETDY